ncbi:MAG: hypothetical protein K9N10_02035 [Deltaproteobacteria bacterium]|nr:hypothetical protein [Deltaproteobacteria bacterium]
MKSLSVFLTVVFLSIILTEKAPAKVTMGGRIYVDCYYLERNRENAQYKHLGNDTFTNTAIQVPNITRLNVNWTNEDNVGMFIQVGVGQTRGGTNGSLNKETGKIINDVNSNGVDLRHAYGWWDLTDNFQFLAGKTTTPISPLVPYQMLGTRSGSLNIIGEGYGELYSGRFAQIRGTYHFTHTVRLAVALVDPNGAALGNYAPYGDPNSYQTDTKLPRIDVGLPIYAGPVSIYPSFLYQRRTVDFLLDHMDGIDNRIDTYIGSLGILAAFGSFQVSAEGNWGQNWSNTGCGIGVSPPARNSAATLYRGQLDDTTTYGWWVDGSYRVGIVTPHILYGQMKSEGDENPMRYKSWFWGISIPIAVTEGFSVVPEFMWYDDGDDNRDDTGFPVDNGRYAIYGVQFQFRF